MPIDVDDLKPANPWHPITDPVTLKQLGKLIEELGELQSALARCIIQGIDEREPVTQKVNRVWVADEIADVLAGINLLREAYFDTEEWNVYILHRREKKQLHLRGWHLLA